MHDTNRRRRKEEPRSESDELTKRPMDTMKGQYKINNIHLNLRNIKLCVVVLIGFIILYQLWRFSYQSSKMEFQDGASEWKFKDHPQGLNKQSFNQLIEDLKTKDSCPHYPFTPKGKPPTTFKLPKMEKVYQSDGSLKFKDGKFILDGKPFRILSGAMHYFRVMPEQWEDRMLKMKAMGLNTLET